MEYHEAQKIAQQLNSYSQYELSETGEVCKMLTQLSVYVSYVSEEFYQALCEEMESQFKNFKRHSRLVERTETTTETYKVLEWSGIDY